jgi:hypothetical protein
LAVALVCITLLLLPGPAVADSDLCEQVVAGSEHQQAMDLAGRLARQLDLTPPNWVELAPVPDLSAGVTYGPVIRLRPAPEPILLATLLHETGHLGPRRSRDVEEAIADLTRRALLGALLAEEPGLAVPLLPLLVPPVVTQDDIAGPAEPASRPVHDARLYQRAHVLAAALWEHAGAGTADLKLDVPDRLARAAVLGRTLSSSQVRDLVPHDRVAFVNLMDRFAAGHILPLLQQALPVSGRRSHQVQLLQTALNAAPENSGWLPWARQALDQDDADRILAHDVLGLRFPGAGGELAFLDEWVAQARSAGTDLSLQRARVRRGMALGMAGRHEAAADELMDVLLEGKAPFLAMEAAVGLVRYRPMAAGEMAALLDMAPSLSSCGAAGTAFKALTLREAGFVPASLPLFVHGDLPGIAWAWHAAWAEALAAVGNRSGAADLLRRNAALWRRLPSGRIPAAAALMAAVTILAEGDGRTAWDAAMALEKIGAWEDGMLAEAGRRWQASGQERKSRRAWKRLLQRVPRSDLAPEAREALKQPGQK